MPPAGFEPIIPASELPQTHALVRAVTGIGNQRLIVSVKLCLCVIASPRHDVIWRSCVNAPPIRNFTIRQRWPVIITLLRKEHPIPVQQQTGWDLGQSGYFREEKHVVLLLRIEPWMFLRAARSLMKISQCIIVVMFWFMPLMSFRNKIMRSVRASIGVTWGAGGEQGVQMPAPIVFQTKNNFLVADLNNVK
jgi:hypothetical protein